MGNVLWTRGHTYVCGIAACIAYSANVFEDATWPRMLYVCDVISAIVVVFVMFCGNGVFSPMDEPHKLWQKIPSLDVALVLFSQGAFSAGVSWLAFRCCSGHLPRLNAFLALRVWVPIARLSFSAYLLQHIAVFGLKTQVSWLISFLGESSERAFFISILCCFGTCIIAFFNAFLLYMVVEGPSIRLRIQMTPTCLKRG